MSEDDRGQLSWWARWSPSIVRVVVFVAASAFVCYRERITIEHSPVVAGLIATLVAAMFVGWVAAWARAGWQVQYPSNLGFLAGGHERPGPFVLGVLEAVLFYGAFLTTAWAVAGGWLVFKAASKWASWQHVMKLPDDHEKAGCDREEYLRFRWAWSSSLLNSFLAGTLGNVIAAGIGVAVAAYAR